jgi:CrcB protein
MDRWFWIGIGGAAGTLARYGLLTWCQHRFGSGFPYGTIAVNLIGSLLLGALMQAAMTTDIVSPTLRLGLGVGFLGGFTTYSTFNLETLKMLQARAWMPAILNASITFFGCLLAGVLGMAATKRILQA